MNTWLIYICLCVCVCVCSNENESVNSLIKWMAFLLLSITWTWIVSFKKRRWLPNNNDESMKTTKEARNSRWNKCVNVYEKKIYLINSKSRLLDWNISSSSTHTRTRRHLHIHKCNCVPFSHNYKNSKISNWVMRLWNELKIFKKKRKMSLDPIWGTQLF